MSATKELPRTLWQTHPGWGISVDLTPREVLQSRQLRVHQRLIGLALALVLTLCVGIALIAQAERSTAQRGYEREQARTAQLAADADQYTVITTMDSVTAQVQATLDGVLGQDLDFVNLMAFISAARPVGLTVTNEAVLLSPPVAAPEATPDIAGDPAPGGTSLAPSTVPVIVGSVTIAGSGPNISDINPFVSRLNRIRGVVDVVPTSVTQSDTGMDYTVTLSITDELYTNRFQPDGAS
ncbi:MAG: hypothetical protein LH468_08240 [Nocardioides sp.]|nr:hypothetical protein [Nocardioides sp.]